MVGEDVPLIISWAMEREKVFGILSILKRGSDACEVRVSYTYKLIALSIKKFAPIGEVRGMQILDRLHGQLIIREWGCRIRRGTLSVIT